MTCDGACRKPLTLSELFNFFSCQEAVTCILSGAHYRTIGSGVHDCVWVDVSVIGGRNFAPSSRASELDAAVSLHAAPSSGAFYVGGHFSVGGNATCLSDLLRGCLDPNNGEASTRDGEMNSSR